MGSDLKWTYGNRAPITKHKLGQSKIATVDDGGGVSLALTPYYKVKRKIEACYTSPSLEPLMCIPRDLVK